MGIVLQLFGLSLLLGLIAYSYWFISSATGPSPDPEECYYCKWDPAGRDWNYCGGCGEKSISRIARSSLEIYDAMKEGVA